MNLTNLHYTELYMSLYTINMNIYINLKLNTVDTQGNVLFIVSYHYRLFLYGVHLISHNTFVHQAKVVALNVLLGVVLKNGSFNK